jgi:hypothetical protein
MAEVTMAYSHSQHKHNFAVWCAARAVQRGFAKSVVLKQALETSGVVEFIVKNGSKALSQQEFDDHHENWCKAILRFCEQNQIKGASYGRAAKLIAIYIKAMIVIQDTQNGLADVAHPPIDSIILQNISRDKAIDHPHKAYWKFIKWTQLDEVIYKQLIADFREVFVGKPFWLIEKYWALTDE